jgi:hypothetical protein
MSQGHREGTGQRDLSGLEVLAALSTRGVSGGVDAAGGVVMVRGPAPAAEKP